ncbi:MAG TPA: MmgE/PrpD family protein [Gaiellaceae bacterium]|nr:MmgE/PrpD family protein [Gaiellaceae bacterium]
MTTAIDRATRTATTQLAEFAATLEYDAVPTEVLEAAKTLILDCIGCTLYASTLPWSRTIQEHVAAEGARGVAGVWGTGLRTSVSLAALANGTAGHGFEIDDVDHRSGLHVGSVTVPVALALAEQDHGWTGKELLAVLVAGFEVGLRVGIAIQPGHFLRGYHPQGTMGPIAAAATAARGLRLDAAGTAHAFGLAGSMAAGLMGAQQGGMVKRLHAGRSAESGVVAARLAQRGFTGTDDVFDIEFGGYCSTLEGLPGATERLVAGVGNLGEEWLTPNVGYKIHASCAANHSTLDVIRRLRDQYGLDADAVASVRVITSRHTVVHCGWAYVPGDIVNAQMSMRYGVAAMLASGSAFVDQFTAERVHDRDLIDLASRVDVIADESIDALGSDHRHITSVEITLRDGSTLEGNAKHRIGSQFEPVGRSEIGKKFRLLTDPLEGVDGDAILSSIVGLDALTETTSLSELIGIRIGAGS